MAKIIVFVPESNMISQAEDIIQEKQLAMCIRDRLYMDNCLGARNDAIGMQYLIPGWKFDPKKPCLVR